MVQRYASPLSGALLEYRQGLATNVVLANVVFGQSSLGCKGNGLCRVDLVTCQASASHDIEESVEEDTCQRLLVTLCHDKDGLRMVIPTEQLSARTIRQHLNEAFFKMAEVFIFSEKLVSKLQLESKIIPVGLYKIKKEKAFITVFLAKAIS